MSYKEKLLKQIEELKKYKALKEKDLGKALEYNNLLKVKAAAEHVAAFTRHIKNVPQNFLCSKDELRAFMDKHNDLFPEGTFPYVSSMNENGDVTIPNVDYEKIFNALEEEFPNSVNNLENEYNKCDSNYDKISHPLENLTNQMKESVDELFDVIEEQQAIQDALDYANEEIVDKLGENIVDSTIDLNGNKRSFEAVIDFPNFVRRNGLDKDKVINHTPHSKKVISPGFTNDPKHFLDYKEFLNMDLTLSDEFKKKIIGLDNLLKEEGLLQKAAGGESDFKEYGMVDYFAKNYALKTAIVEHSKLTNNEDKVNSLRNIKQKVDELKEVKSKYDKVFKYIKDNFDINDISLPINVYAGRPKQVENGNLANWRPNLPPKYDNENAPYTVILSGFSQLKAACQDFNSSLEDYLDHPIQTYINQAREIGAKEDRKYYIPRSEENTLGKRMARALVTPSRCYGELSTFNMVGGRGTEFLYNVSDHSDKTNDNVIIANINKDYTNLFMHSPELMFGRRDRPDINNLKNLFANGDKTDQLYKVSNKYYTEDTCEKGTLCDQYTQGLKDRKNVPIEEEYRRVMNALKDYNAESKNILREPVVTKSGQPDYHVGYSFGTMAFAGREYLSDYIKENNLSLLSIEDKKLRDEITDFMVDPMNVITKKHIKEADLASETKANAVNCFNRELQKNRRPVDKTQEFIKRFNDHNNKPGSGNRNKNFLKILSDNKGGIFERWRGTTSKEYTALKKISAAVVDINSPSFGDYESAYKYAIAYKNYKMPEGVRYENLKDIEKRRIDFCDSIIQAYEDEHKPQVQEQIEDNNIIDNTKNFVDNQSFQNQLKNDIQVKNEIPNKIEIKEKVEEKQIENSIDEETLE